MLSIKAPIETVLKSDFLQTNESFCQRILGNYEQLGQRIFPEDLMHVVTQPPEIFLVGGDAPQFMNQTDVKNIQIQKVEVLNQLLNRILIAADGHITYQDEVYITNVLHKFGIKNQQEFMHQVYKMTKDTKNTNKLLATYQSNYTRLSELIREYSQENTEIQNTEFTDIKNEILHLHEDINRRWMAGDLYRMEQSFRYSPQGDTTVSQEIYQMAEQIRLSQQLKLQELRTEVRGEFVPLIYHHENVFEGEDELPPKITESYIEEKIASAVLLSLVDNLYQSTYERVNHDIENWYHTEYSYYGAGDNVFRRMQENTQYRQLLYEESRISADQSLSVQEEQNIIEQISRISQQNEFINRTEGDAFNFEQVDLTLAVSNEENTEQVENLTEKNTIEQQLYQQNLKNERRQKTYLSNLRQVVEEYRESTIPSAQEKTRRDMLFALEHPDEFKREYQSETLKEQQRALAAEQEAVSQMSVPERQIAELIKNYIANPVQYLEGNMVKNEDLTLLYYDSVAEPEQIERLERETNLNLTERLIRENTYTRPGVSERAEEEQNTGIAEAVPNEGEYIVSEGGELIYREGQPVRTQEALAEGEARRISAEYSREYNTVLRELREGAAAAATEAGRSAQTGALAGEAPETEGAGIIYRQEVSKTDNITERFESENRTLIERQREYNNILREFVLQISEADKKGELPFLSDGEEQEAVVSGEGLIYRIEKSEGAGEKEILSRSQTVIERSTLYNEIIERVSERVEEEARAKATETKAEQDMPFAENETELTHIKRRDLTEAEERLLKETELITMRQNNINRILEDIKREPVRRADQKEEKAPENIHFVHRSTVSTVDEETIEELRETLRRNEQNSTRTNESVERVQNVENKVIREENKQIITQQSEEEIAAIINRSLHNRLDEITGKVYNRLERQLNNERRRRGL